MTSPTRIRKSGTQHTGRAPSYPADRSRRARPMGAGSRSCRLCLPPPPPCIPLHIQPAEISIKPMCARAALSALSVLGGSRPPGEVGDWLCYRSGGTVRRRLLCCHCSDLVAPCCCFAAPCCGRCDRHIPKSLLCSAPLHSVVSCAAAAAAAAAAAIVAAAAALCCTDRASAAQRSRCQAPISQSLSISQAVSQS